MIDNPIVAAVVAAVLALVVSVPTSLLLIALLRREPVPWRDYVAHFLGKRPRGG